MPRIKQLLSSAGAALLLASGVLSCSMGAQVPASAQTDSPAIRALNAVPQANRVGANADFSRRVPMGGHLPAWARADQQVAGHSVDLSSSLRLSITLQRDPAVQAAFEQLLKDQQTPGSPLYHQWLTPQQIGDLYGPTPDDVAAVQSWLTSQGFAVDSVAPSRMLIQFHGTASTAGNAFQTRFAYFNMGIVERRSITSEPMLPAALTPVVAAIRGLTEVVREPQHHIAKPRPSEGPSPNVSYGGYYAVTPNDFAVIYDVKSVYSGGNTGATIAGTTQHVAIVATADVADSDVAAYVTATGLPGYHLNRVLADGTNPGTGYYLYGEEATLDVERVVGTANGAQVDLVLGADPSIETQISYNINNLLDPVMSISFGSCEANATASYVTADDTMFSQAAAEGISTFVASGDSGASGCEQAGGVPNGSAVLSPNELCSSSYVTCVGGTAFNDPNKATYWSKTNGPGLQSALSYIPEGAWNDGGSRVASSGGGVSSVIKKPLWQAGVGVPADGYRDTPDISFLADDDTGYLFCDASEGYTCPNFAYGSFAVGGTSASAPSMAGVAALLNTAQGSRQGNINPLLYKLAASTPAAFHDITVASSGVTNCTATPSMCNNSTPGSSPGYFLTTGYDQVTGLGSLDVANFLTAAAMGVDLRVASTHTGKFIASDPGGTYTLTVSNAGGPASSGTVTVIDTLPSGFTATAMSGTGWTCDVPSVTCTRSDALAAGTSYPGITLTVKIASNDAGTYTNNVSVSGGGEGGSPDWTSGDTTVVGGNSAAVLSISFSPANIAPNALSTMVITVTNPPGNTTLNNVAFSNILPSGVVYAGGFSYNYCGNSGATFPQGTPQGMYNPTSGAITPAYGWMPPGSSCSFKESVSSASIGTYLDTTSPVTSQNALTGKGATATLTVSVPVTATKVTFKTAPAGTFTAGGNAGAVQAALEDAAGNIATNLSGTTITLTVTGPGGYSKSYSGNTTNGVVLFDLSSTPLTVAGAYTYTAASAGLTSVTASETVNVGPLAGILLSGLTSEPQPGVQQTATVRAVDSSGNVVPSFTGTVTLSSTAGPAYAQYSQSPYTYVSSDAGTHAFTVTIYESGTYSVTATSGSYTSTVSGLVIQPYVYVASANGILSTFSDIGTAISPTNGYSINTGGVEPAGAITVDQYGAIYSVDNTHSKIIEFDNGVVVTGSRYSGGGLSGPTALALDGLSRLWVTDGTGAVSLFDSSGNALSPSTGLTGGSNPYSAPSGVAIDLSGNVWVANKSNNTVMEILGAAGPAAPLSTAVANVTTGARP